jgi:hypothetical protein
VISKCLRPNRRSSSRLFNAWTSSRKPWISFCASRLSLFSVPKGALC